MGNRDSRGGMRQATGPADRFTVDQIAELYPVVKGIARRALRGERLRVTRSTTDLHHDTLVRLLGAPSFKDGWESKGHFVAAFTRNARLVLIDHARRRLREKRSGPWERVPLDEAHVLVERDPALLVSIDDLVGAIADCPNLPDPSRAREVFELRFYAGITLDEIAGQVQAGKDTVRRDLRTVRQWMASRLGRGDHGAEG